MALSIQFLGTGTSVGVPQIGCTCPTCISQDPRDKRRRTGVHVVTDRTAFLIDTPPEMRLSALDLGITKVEAVVITHCHMDHIAAFDDVRRFNTLNGKPGPDGKIVGVPMRCYGAPETIAGLRAVFPYITDKANAQGLYRPMINFVLVNSAFQLADATITPLPVKHGPRTNGYRIDCGGHSIGYVPDCKVIPESTLALMRGLDVLVLDCLRERVHPTHLNLDEALAYVRQLTPRQTYLVHMSHDVKHAEFEGRLPTGVRLAYDGLKVAF